MSAGDLSLKEAAATLGVSKDTIYRGLDAEPCEFPNAYRVFGHGPWRIPRSDIEAARERWRKCAQGVGGNQT
jgi:excisionase family DNA binding protein